MGSYWKFLNNLFRSVKVEPSTGETVEKSTKVEISRENENFRQEETLISPHDGKDRSGEPAVVHPRCFIYFFF